MRGNFLVTACVLALLAVQAPVHAAGLYISGDFGMNFGASLDSNGASNDRASVCDEYINPQYASVTDDGQGKSCTAPGRGLGDGWDNGFSSDEGPLFALALGYRLQDSAFRTELEYFFRDTGYDETARSPRPWASTRTRLPRRSSRRPTASTA